VIDHTWAARHAYFADDDSHNGRNMGARLRRVCIKICLDLRVEARIVTHKENACDRVARRNHDDWDVHLENNVTETRWHANNHDFDHHHIQGAGRSNYCAQNSAHHHRATLGDKVCAEGIIYVLDYIRTVPRCRCRNGKRTVL